MRHWMRRKSQILKRTIAVVLVNKINSWGACGIYECSTQFFSNVDTFRTTCTHRFSGIYKSDH